MDNGSLRPESTLQLRKLARSLSNRLGEQVHPVSLLHSSKIAPEELEGLPAETMVSFVKKHSQSPETHFIIIPLFFGKSSAFVDYLPERMKWLQDEKGLAFSYEIKRELCPLNDPPEELLSILIDHALAVRKAFSGKKPTLLLVDHGTPLREVNQVRNLLTVKLRERIGEDFSEVAEASMESREGEEYAFNQPLLKDLLLNHGERKSRVPIVVLMQFLLPGRHAGPAGDVAQIIESVRNVYPNIGYKMSPLVAENPKLVSLLEKRLRE